MPTLLQGGPFNGVRWRDQPIPPAHTITFPIAPAHTGKYTTIGYRYHHLEADGTLVYQFEEQPHPGPRDPVLEQEC